MRWRVLVAAIVALVVVTGAGVAAFAYSTTQSAALHSAALRELESARQRNNAAYASLHDPALKAELQNIDSLQQARTAMNDYRARVGGDIKLTEAKLAELRQERDRLRSASTDPLLFTGHQQLERDRARVEAAANAFDSADRFLTIADSHAKVFNATLTALWELGNIGAWVDAGNLSQAAALVPQLKQQLQLTATAAQGVEAAPAMRAVIEALSHVATDVDQMLAAEQSNDRAAFDRLQPQLQKDVDAVNSAFDANAINAYEHQLLDPYRARYRAEAQRAGFDLSNPST